MSVGDIKGFRRRLRLLAAKGHMPAKAGLSVAESIERQRAIAAKKVRK